MESLFVCIDWDKAKHCFNGLFQRSLPSVLHDRTLTHFRRWEGCVGLLSISHAMVSGVLFRKKPLGEISAENEVNFRHVSGGDTTSCGSSSDVTVATTPTRSRVLHHLRRLVFPLALGQFLSAIIATTGISSQYLVNFGISLPLAQNLPHYVLLAIIYGAISWTRLLSSSSEVSSSCSHKFVKFLRTKAWQYFIAGTFDVHANWAIVSAYAYTNLTSVQLLDCLTIPTAMVLSRFCLKTRYKLIHVIGVLICLAGAGSMVGADYLAAKEAGLNSTADETKRSHHISSVLLGDFLVIAGAIGYGISNVYEEFLVRKYGVLDYLSFASFSAAIWIVIYCSTFEREAIVAAIRALNSENLPPIMGCLIGFAVAMFLLYSVMPVALSKTNAVLVNLSLLTADLYALLIGIYLFGNVFHPLYLASFAAIMLGVCLFASRDPIFREITEAAKEEDGI